MSTLTPKTIEHQYQKEKYTLTSLHFALYRG